MSDRRKIDAILQQIKDWTSDDRKELANELLTNEQPKPRARPKISDLLGIARGEGPAPTDEQVEQWMDEHRQEKYGR